MKKFLLGTVALVAMATSASAADLAARPYTKAPAFIAAAYDWSGFYIGANGGYGTSRKCWDLTVVGVFAAAEGCHDAEGGTAGGQVGYRFQSGGWVFGVEGQGNWADLRGSNLSLVPALAAAGVTNRSRLDAFGLFTGQVGYAWNNALLYVKGGGAVTSNRYDTFVGGALTSSVRDDTRFGGTAGVGLEYGFAPNWSAAVEYDHIFVENRGYNFTTPAGAAAGSDRIRGDVDLITARINYRWGGPVVAKY